MGGGEHETGDGKTFSSETDELLCEFNRYQVPSPYVYMYVDLHVVQKIKEEHMFGMHFPFEKHYFHSS